MKVLGICGSLRLGSSNKRLLMNFASMLLQNDTFQMMDIGSFPLFNEDLEEDIPVSVQKAVDQVKNAEFIVISTPEYNYSYPGVLKNALDWLSREYDGVYPLTRKPVAIMGVSDGHFGTARAQILLRELIFKLNMNLLTRPEVYVPFGKEKFDDQGKLNDERTSRYLRRLIDAIHSFQ